MGYHWLGGEARVSGTSEFAGINTPEDCQIKCTENPECNWFTWLGSNCWLFEKKGSTKNYDGGRNNGATGPKRCSGINKY